MAPHLNIVASCTDRKRGVVLRERRLGEIPDGAADARAARWWKSLTSPIGQVGLTGITDTSAIAAADVYVGEQWTLVHGLTANLRQAGWHVNLWITSAGYGLLSDQTPIHPYSSTFSVDSPDTVAKDRGGAARHAYHRDWWAALAALRSAVEEGPTTLAELARQDPNAGMLVLASPDYVRAIQDDLLVAAERMRHPECLAILTSDDGWTTSPLRDNLVILDDRVRGKWGGTMQGLHARAALHLYKDAGADRKSFSAHALRDRYTAMVDDAPKPERHNRDRMSDGEVIDFLRAELTKNPDAGWTLLLRTLRNSGRACEQKRFRGLHAEISSSLRAGKSRETDET